MFLCIRLTKFSILAIFISSLLLSIRIPFINSIDLVNENTVNSRINSTEEDNQTAIIDQHTSPLNDNVSIALVPQIPSIAENDAPIISTENKSDLSDEVVSSIVPDNQTNDDQTTTPTTTKKNLSSINSFEEWKQQQLHTDLLRKGDIASRNSVTSEAHLASISKGSSSPTNIQQTATATGATKKGKLRKNFASASCGAKILAHNVEAQNVASVLSSSPDEYMLNPCNAKIWFVIELCESIRILNIEIANLELFSSVPKTFRVFTSDRYPTKDWHRHLLGTFNASFNRTVQSFPTLESTTYLKYVKFEFLDFHGHEHYCPLSVVRIHGSNVEDEIMTMEDNTNSNDVKSPADIPDANENDDDDDDDNNDPTNDQQVGGIIGSAILDLAKRVFRRQTIRGTSSTTSIPIIENNVLKTDCHPSILNGSLINESLTNWHRSEAFKQCIAEFLDGLWSKFDTCTIYLSQICLKLKYCCQCPLMNNQTKPSISTLNIYINPCGYYHILTSQFVCKKSQLIPLNDTLSASNNGNLTQEFDEKNLTVDKNDTVIISDENGNSSIGQSALNLTEMVSNETQPEPVNNRSHDQPSPANISNETTVLLELHNTSNETSSQLFIPEPVPTVSNTTELSTEINHVDETTVTPTTTTASTISNSNEVMAPMIASPWLKGMLVNTKSLPELFKIIEKLNFNLTLSNRYLQELSQHYLKKIDETQQTTDLLLKSSNSANRKLENLEDQLDKLQENFHDISYRLIKLEAWIPLIVCMITCLFIWCLWSTCRLIHLRRKFQSLTSELETIRNMKHIEIDKVEEDEDDPPVFCNGYNKRKLSTDSSDSNPARSQRVPDLPLSKIVENGTTKFEHDLKEINGNQTSLT